MKKTSCALSNNRQETLHAFNRLLTIMDELRENCPWDKKQTWDSLRHLTIEELYELSEAIMEGDTEGVKEELGDIMLHVAFYARIATENNFFTMVEVLNAICDKLIERHPHVYGSEIVKNEQAVKKNWEKIKLKKGKSTVLQGVPKALPAMIKAIRIQDKVRNIGFDFEDKTQVWENIEEEMGGLKNEISKPSNKEKIEVKFGNILFSLVNYARFVDINPEEALEQSNKKFIKRFQYMEAELHRAGVKIEDMTSNEMNTHWGEAKSTE